MEKYVLQSGLLASDLGNLWDGNFCLHTCQLFGIGMTGLCIYFWQRSLATDLQNLSMELRRKQSTYLKRLQQQKEVVTDSSIYFCGLTAS